MSDGPQLSIFDMEPISEAEQLSFMPAMQYSQEIIDDALRVGANDRNSRMIIAAYFSKDKGDAANTLFLREHYGINGAGFFHGNQQYAIWHDADGIRLAAGETVRSRMAMTISWEAAATRIRELLDEGRYMDREELSNVREYELNTLSNEFALAARDITQEAREAGFAPTILAAIPGIFPESADNIAALISDPASLQTVINEWTEVVEAYEQGQDVFRFRVPAQRFLNRLRDMQIEPLTFTAANDLRPEQRLFISRDEIDNVLRGHRSNSEYRLGIYSYYQRNGERKDRENYLKNVHGEHTGSYGGNDNLEYVRGKGMMYAHGPIGNYTAEVHLSWNHAEKRIAAMISEDRFLSDADRLAMPEYERRQLARTICNAFYDTPDGMERPFSGNPIGDYWENVQEVQIQLSTTAQTEQVFQMLDDLVRETFPMERHYEERQRALADLTAYREGTYSLFGEQKTPIVIEESASAETTPVATETTEPATPAEETIAEESPDPDMQEAIDLINAYCHEEFDSDADFSDLSHVDLAFSHTEDHEHSVEVSADLMAFRMVYAVDSEIVATIDCSNLAELNKYLANLDFAEMISYAEEYYVPEEEPPQEDLEDDFSDIDPAAVREHLAQAGIVDGAVVDPDALASDPFIRQVTSDVEQIAQEKSVPVYQVGDTAYLEGTAYEITEIGDYDVQLRDPTQSYPIFRSEPKERFEQLLYQDERNQPERDAEPEYTTETVAVYPAEENNLPYDIEIQTIRVNEPEQAQEMETAQSGPIPAANFHITDDNLGHGTVREKYNANITAIRLLKRLESENRNATPAEQEILSRYVGWGGLAQAFDPDNSAWSKEYQELRDVLEEYEYRDANESVLNAHYTSPTVIKAIYEAVGNMGFTSGNILEPSCGVGNFFGLLPKEMSGSRLYGVELDSITGRIARKLYPQADITVAGFETTDRSNFYDLAIGNIPFGQYRVSDRAYDNLGFSIHNYFFAKTIDQVRPGGIIAFVTSRYTMDSKSEDARKYIAERADLLGAIRLPNNAFLANAGTSVVADILLLQKRERVIATEPDWIHLGETEDGITLNSYFIDHPEMVLGELTTKSTQYGRDECTVKPISDADLGQQLHEAIQHIHGQYIENRMTAAVEEVDTSVPADPEVRNFSFTVVDGQIYYRENSRMNRITLSEGNRNRVLALIELRDCVRTLISLESSDAPPNDVIAQRVRLNDLYDAFEQKYGRINGRSNRLVFSDDDSYYLLCSLEVLDDEQNFKEKADIFTKNTIRPITVVTKVETAQEALVVSLNEFAKVNMEYMTGLTGKSAAEIEQELSGQIFRLPGSDPEKPTFVLAEEYLSGNVRKKLTEAQEAAAEDPIYAANVTALEAVQPKDLTAAEISVRLGSIWVPEDDIKDFIVDLLWPQWYVSAKMEVAYSSYTGAWNISHKSMDHSNIRSYSTYGTKRMNAYEIIEASLNLRDAKVFDYYEEDGKRKAVLNKKETAIAQGKQAEIKQAFQDWIWKDPERRDRLTRLYNDKFNNIRPREYDGSHLVFPGMNPEIQLRPHQQNAIARALYGGNTLLAHCVGAGKTFEMVAIAQESKRLGLCHKSMVVVPNHLIGQWASEYLQLYPAANILVTTEKDFSTARRKTFCARIATGDYDAVIIGHSQFEKIPLSKERQIMEIERQIDDIVIGMEEAKRNKGENFSVKQMARAKKSAEAKLKKLNDQSRKDDVVTFEELGIDRLLVDEAHSYKNLAVVTKMTNVAGISQTEAQKASDMFMKCRHLDDVTDSHGVIFATGTPVSNTMVEMFTMQRYLQHKTLEWYGLSHFDAWAANFGETVTAIELAPEGTGYRTKTRFARFYNLPELIYMFREVADIQTADMLKLPVPEANYHTEQLEPSEIQASMVKELSERADKVRDKKVDPKEDNMLRITGDGRKLALDQRLMDGMLPDDPESKTAVCARNVFEVWQRTADTKGAQIIFCDLSTPHFDGSFNVYDDLRAKLIEKGIPEEEIRFIHEAPTDAKKKELFAKVRTGAVRVLIGSTAKMGTGTNVQSRLAAMHDLDAPWRPADLEQRSGRIIRQGNMYPEVDIYRYVTKNTFDAYSWQILETKQKFISQIMTSKSPARSMEDADESTLSYAEIKALATGNPLIKEKMDLDVTVSRLTLLKNSYLNQKYELEDQIRRYIPAQITMTEREIKEFEHDFSQVKATRLEDSSQLSPMVLEGKTYTDRKEAGSALLEICMAKTTPEATKLGSYRGFSMSLEFNEVQKQFTLRLDRTRTYTIVLGHDVLGNLQRIDNGLESLEKVLTDRRNTLEELHTKLETAKEEVQKPFSREQELTEKSARLQSLNALLNMDQKDDAILDDAETEVSAMEQEQARLRDAR